MNYAIEKGKAFYWATSEWKASQIMEAFAICDKLGLIRPIADQCQYNMLIRDKIESEYTHLFDKHNYGTTVWSPLYSGVLTGKYRDAIEIGTRMNDKSEASRHKQVYLSNKKSWDEKIDKLAEIAARFESSITQLALAWLIKNPNVSTCILGTSKVDQLQENFKALDIVEKIDDKVEAEIDEILGNSPMQEVYWRTIEVLDKRRVIINRRNEWIKISKGK